MYKLLRKLFANTLEAGSLGLIAVACFKIDEVVGLVALGIVGVIVARGIGETE